MDKKRIAAAYIRVSTDDQTEYSPDSQIKLIRDYGKKHGFVVPDEYIFRDDGISGRSAAKRPAFQLMIAAAKEKPRPFETILVWKFSRFARNQEESIVYKSLLKKENNIDVVSISEPLMEGPFGELIERIIEWFDAFYSLNLATEVRRGMTERVQQGGTVSVAPFGYRYQDRQLVIEPEKAEIVRMVYADFLSGVPILTIAKK
jgi:site-specific DNA recombinase